MKRILVLLLGIFLLVGSVSAAIVDFTPLMTNDTSPAPNNTSASSVYPGADAWNTFNKNFTDNNGWSTNNQNTGTIYINLSSGHILSNYTIYGCVATAVCNRAPTAFTIYGSNDSVSWVTLNSQSAQSFTTSLTNYTYNISNTVSYSRYKIYIWGGAAYTGLQEVILYEDIIAGIPIPNFTSNVTNGVAPLSIQFNDTSVTNITAWNWSYTNIIPGNNTQIWWSTVQNATQTFGNGHWHIQLNVTNASGSALSSGTYGITVDDSGGLSGWNRQDIMMDQIYTLTLNIKDATTHNGIPSAVIQTSSGDNTTTDLFGVATFSTNYTVFVVNVGATGYYSRSMSYVVDRDRDETIYLTKVPANATPQTITYYTPWQVRIRIADFNGNPLPGTSVTANYMATTLPSTDPLWLESAFGVTAAVAYEMVDSGLAMAGVTDSNGGLSFTMFKSIQYSLLITNTTSGVSATKNLYPSDQEYLIRVPLAGQVPVNNTLASMASTSLPVYQLNATAYNLSVIYKDTSGLTDKVLFIVKYRNGTVLLNQDLGNPGTGTVVGNYTVNNIGIGTEILWSYNARRVGT